MSKKLSEFDRYERMKKMEKEAEVEKRKSEGGIKKKGGRPKVGFANAGSRDWSKNHDEIEEFDYY